MARFVICGRPGARHRCWLVAALIVAATATAACGGNDSDDGPSGEPSTTATTPATKLEADVDVGARTMHLVCVGPLETGEPTILLEAGGGGDYLSWGQILDVMQPTHRLCAYDRAGLGQSDPPAEASRTAGDQAADLHALLDAADVSGPFVLGAHSDGATVATLFTQAYPEDVAGLLFVEPRGPHVSKMFKNALGERAADEPASVTEFRDQLETFETDPSLNPEHLHLQKSFAQAAAAVDEHGPLFGDRPVVVLSAETTPGPQLGLPPRLARTIDRIWAAGQQELADESTAGLRETVSGTGHEIQVDKPSAVVDALERILDALAT